MNNERWNEICFLLSENVRTDSSESDFEQNVLRALSVMNWKEYSGDIEIRPNFQIGASNRITPDFIIKSSDHRKLFVIEIKQPSIPLNSKFQQQLFSYMRQLKLEYGILIGQGIQIFYDGELNKQEDPILLETINFTRDNEKGLNFVGLFAKENFSQESLKFFTIHALQKINRREEQKNLAKKMLEESFHIEIKELIKQKFLNEYDGEMIDAVLGELIIEVKGKNVDLSQPIKPTPQIVNQRIVEYSNGILPIILNPPSEGDFKRRLLATRTAYITVYFKDGTIQEKEWNAKYFSETSGVIGNLRSRSEFRNGTWQKMGIEKVYVSIDKQRGTF